MRYKPTIKIPSLLLLLLLATLAKGFFTAILVPLFEFPDEQAHFAQVSHYVESGLNLSGPNLSKEIYLHEQVLGTLRDERGNNRYTYNPFYRPVYSGSYTGPREVFLKSLPTQYRSQFVKSEAAGYSPLFYLISSLAYLLVYPANLFIRLFATRLTSIILMALSVLASYHFGRLLFPKSKFLALTLASLVSFHPMFSFVSSGVNNDNLANLIAIILLYLSVYLLHHPLTLRLSFIVTLTIFLSFASKSTLLPLYPVFFISFLYNWFHSHHSFYQQLKRSWPLIILGLLFLFWLFYLPSLSGRHWLSRFYLSPNLSNQLAFSSYLATQLRRYYSETFVWYWGIFKWLGVTLPFFWIRAIKLLIIASGIGLIKAFWSGTNPVRRNLMLLLAATFIQIVLLTIWDYLLLRNLGFSHGIQGRYFFPAILAHLSLILYGLVYLIPQRFHRQLSLFLIGFFILLHAVSLLTLAQNYYATHDLNQFFLEVSQYKPWFAKYPWFLLWLGLYISATLAFFVSFLKKYLFKKS